MVWMDNSYDNHTCIMSNSTCTTSATSWPLWHSATNNGTHSVIAVNSNIYAANTTASTTTIWPMWHQAVIQLTEEQYLTFVEAERQRELQYQEEIQQHRAKVAEQSKRREEAEKRAKAILIEHLTPEQQETIEKNKWFVVVGSKTGKTYRIKTGNYAGNIEEIEKDSIPKAKYCCHVSHALPMSDHHLTQKMMIESDEDEFLRVANCTHF